MIRILNSINEYAAGIYTIIFGVEVLAVVIIGAIGSGTMTLTSEATGRKDLAQYKGITLCAYAVCTIVTVVMIVGAVLFPEQILSLFTSDKTVIASLWRLFAADWYKSVLEIRKYYYRKCHSWKRKYKVDVVYSDFWNDLDRGCSISLGICL